jgi:hypothetical protein
VDEVKNQTTMKMARGCETRDPSVVRASEGKKKKRRASRGEDRR